jgi:hypothetical protein
MKVPVSSECGVWHGRKNERAVYGVEQVLHGAQVAARVVQVLVVEIGIEQDAHRGPAARRGDMGLQPRVGIGCDVAVFCAPVGILIQLDRRTRMQWHWRSS